MRPDHLADDYTITADVISHALDWFETHKHKVDYVLTVYPTAVMLSEEDIKGAMATLEADTDCDGVMSAMSFPFPIQRAVFENERGYAEMFSPHHYQTRSQDLTEAMHDAGQFYLNKASAVREGKLLTNAQVRLHMLDRRKVVDIDTHEDFEIAEEKLNLYRAGACQSAWQFDNKKG